MVVLKGDGDVRVCVDMRRANEAIVRERHPIPTVEELLHDLRGSTVFTVFSADLKGFKSFSTRTADTSRPTFVTHRGLYRFKQSDVWSDVCAREVPADY